MNVDDIRTLYAFNQWADQRILAGAEKLSADDFIRDLGTSHGSVRGTLVHILGGEWIWLQLWRGGESKQIVAARDEMWKPDRFPRAASLESMCQDLVRDQNAFIEGLTDERLAARTSFVNSRGVQCEFSLEHMMLHVVNHSSYHRGQVVSLLRQLGQAPPSTDFALYLLETST